MEYDFKKLKEDRELLMLTITELSMLSDVPISTIHAVERGVGASWKKAFRKIRRALDEQQSGRKRISA